MALISAEAGATGFDPLLSAAGLSLHQSTYEILLCAPQLFGLSGLRSREKQPARGSAAMREPDRIVRLKTVLSRTGLSRSTIYRKIADGTFPAQLKISANGTGWHESEFYRWIADPVGWRPIGEFD